VKPKFLGKCLENIIELPQVMSSLALASSLFCKNIDFLLDELLMLVP
jgi:hypothetical protein